MNRFCYELNGGGTVELEDILGRELHAGDYVCVGAYVQLDGKELKSILLISDDFLIAENADNGEHHIIGKRVCYNASSEILSVCLLGTDEGDTILQKYNKFRGCHQCKLGFDIVDNDLHAGDLVLFTNCELRQGYYRIAKLSIHYTDESLQFNVGVVVGNNEFFDGKKIVKDMVVWKLSTSSSELVNRKTELNQAYSKFAARVVNVQNKIVTVGDTFVWRERYYTCTKVYNKNGKRSYEYLKFRTDKLWCVDYFNKLQKDNLTERDIENYKTYCAADRVNIEKFSDKAIGEFVGHYVIKQ